MTHRTISFIKSGIRMVGYLFLIPVARAAAIFLLLSEAAGVLEEVGDNGKQAVS